MSQTDVIAVYPGDRVDVLDEYGNSWGSAPIIWELMAARYLSVTRSYDHPNKGYMQLGDTLWNLWKDPRVKTEHKAVFMLTFDRAYVAKKDYPRMADAIKVFLEDFSIPSDNVNHWPALRELFLSNPDVPGIGLHCTSVSVNPFCGKWNEEKEDYDPPDWDDIYELFGEIDSLTVSRGA
jgi:hypothetical protein